MKFSHQKFFALYKKHFGDFSSAEQKTVDGIEFFLSKFDQETRLKNIPQFAYVLATTFHESFVPRTGIRFQPVKEIRERSSSPRRARQDAYWRTGYYGRGFPQTTWEENYLKSGQALGLGDLFVKNPDLLLQPHYAYEAMIVCMTKGLYRKGKSLNKFLPGKTATLEQLTAARDIINGDIKKNGAHIARIAQTFIEILSASVLSFSTNLDVATSTNPADNPQIGNEEPPKTGISADNISASAQIGENITNNVSVGDQRAPDDFVAETMTQYIPQITKGKWILGGTSFAGFCATIAAKVAAMPDWLVFLLGVLTGIALTGLVVLIVIYYRQILALVQTVVKTNADPLKHNIVLTQRKNA